MSHSDFDLALQPMTIVYNPVGKFSDSIRRFQGIPTLERTPSGRLWAAFYGGGTGENLENFVLLLYSDNDGITWRKYLALDMPDAPVRAYDPCLWVAPDGRLFLFYAQTYCVNGEEGYNPTCDGRCGVWCITSSDPDCPNPAFTAPRRVANGVMMDKPTVTSDGTWLLPCAIWQFVRNYAIDLPEERFPNVYASTDNGETFSLIGRADHPQRFIDEHQIVQRLDGSLRMYIRCRAEYGIGIADSFDGGKTWENMRQAGIASPCSRFYIRRTASGKLLLVNHATGLDRKELTAYLSADDGETWEGGLLLDSRSGCSYPDGTEGPDGTFYVVHDYNRYGSGEVYVSRFTEEDVLAGKIVSEDSYLRRLVSCIGGNRYKPQA
ncbi:MAG: exo-alpha-sialidase [Ruminococcaceae bacterium]|nr:exo-alpha-sialidase [Oscillospiraceae bacterium]